MVSVNIWKVITNLVIIKTHHLLIDLSVSYETYQKLCKLVEVRFLLSNHTVERYTFLGVNVGVTEMRCCSMFVTILGKLHMVDLGDGEEKFEGFMIRLVSTFKQLDQVLVAGGFNSENVKRW